MNPTLVLLFAIVGGTTSAQSLPLSILPLPSNSTSSVALPTTTLGGPGPVQPPGTTILPTPTTTGNTTSEPLSFTTVATNSSTSAATTTSIVSITSTVPSPSTTPTSGTTVTSAAASSPAASGTNDAISLPVCGSVAWAVALGGMAVLMMD